MHRKKMIKPDENSLAARLPMSGTLPEGQQFKVAGWGLDSLVIEGETLKRRGTDEDARFPYIVLIPSSDATVSAKKEAMTDADVKALPSAVTMLLNTLVKRIMVILDGKLALIERKGQFASLYREVLRKHSTIGEGMPAFMEAVDGKTFTARNVSCIKQDEKGRQYPGSYVELH